MSELIFSFDCKLATLPENYTSHVDIYDDHAHIDRSGRTNLPKKSDVYYNDVTAITFGSQAGRTWIQFAVSGAHVTQQPVQIKKKFQAQVAVYDIPYRDQFAIISSLGAKKEFETHYEKIQEAYNRYKQSRAASGGASVTNVITQESAADKLKKLKELLDMGALSQDEFDEKKTELMQQI